MRIFNAVGTPILTRGPPAPLLRDRNTEVRSVGRPDASALDAALKVTGDVVSGLRSWMEMSIPLPLSTLDRQPRPSGEKRGAVVHYRLGQQWRRSSGAVERRQGHSRRRCPC